MFGSPAQFVPYRADRPYRRGPGRAVKRITVKEPQKKINLKIDREVKQVYDRLAKRSKRSRNELVCLALNYALEHQIFGQEDDMEQDAVKKD